MAKQESQPPQHQDQQPGKESQMTPRPSTAGPAHRGSDKLLGRCALITGGDSGIGRATAVALAREGADIAIAYLEEHDDARETERLVQAEGRRALLLPGDLGVEAHCRDVIDRVLGELGHLDILINNAAEQHPKEGDDPAEALLRISEDQLTRTFRTNVFALFFLTRAALPHLPDGAAIINTTSVTAYKGSPHLLDYAATKGAIVAFTRSLSQALAGRKIRVNAVAPGPIWTPLIPSTFSKDHVAKFGKDTPLGRPGQPDEVAPCYVFLASADASYMTGQVLHPNGGTIVNG